jgi:hypothetical protein
MNIYKFSCTVWVRGHTAKEASEHLHEETAYHFANDNNLISLESDKGVFVERENEYFD